MIIVLKPLSPKEDNERVENMVKARGLDTHVIEGAEMAISARLSPPTLTPDTSMMELSGWKARLANL